MENMDAEETSPLSKELARIGSVKLTPQQKERVLAWGKRWKDIVLASGPTDRRRATDAIYALYHNAGLPQPAVVFAHSPLVLAFASGVAAGLWHLAEAAPGRAASARAAALQAVEEIAAQAGGSEESRQTMAATLRQAIAIATRDVPWPIVDAPASVPQVRDSLWDTQSAARVVCQELDDFRDTRLWPLYDDIWKAAMNAFCQRDSSERFQYGDYAATFNEGRRWEHLGRIDKMRKAALAKATSQEVRFFLECVDQSAGPGDAPFTQECAFLSFLRDVAGWTSPQLAAYAHFETLAETVGPVAVHPHYCIVSDRAAELHFTDRNGVLRLHNESGPSCRWVDGWTSWHLNGVHLPDNGEQIIMRPQTQTIADIDGEDNEEVRRIRIERFGWMRYLNQTNAEVIDSRRNDIENTRELLCHREAMRVLVCHCPSTARVYALEVPRKIQTCAQAQQWLWNTSGSPYGQPRIIGRS